MDAEAVHRTLESLVDTRPPRCHDHAYEFTRLDSTDTITSIIMSYHNAEFYNVKLALTAIIEHTPYDLYTEIIVLDDGTTDDRIRRATTAFLRDPKFNKVLCILLLLIFAHMYVEVLKGKGKCIAVHGTPSHSYGVSLTIWDHTVLPATQHK